MSTISDIDRVALQFASILDPSSTGVAWSKNAGGFGPEGFLREMAKDFINKTGITDIRDIGVS